MAKNYDSYAYEDSSSRISIVRRILIILMIIISIILIIYLITSCTRKPSVKPTPSGGNNTGNTTTNIDYEGDLLAAGKNYFSYHNDDNPTAPGECSIVELQTLVDEKLINADNFNNCNHNTTYVKLCLLEDNRKQYTPWVSCINYNSEELYDELKQGTTNDIIADKTYVEFKFIPLASSKGEKLLGEVETYWKNEIPYEEYKTLSSTKYYRYKDKLYKWNLIKRTYYSFLGSTEEVSDVKDYYISAPNTIYKNKGEKATAYKWYTASGKKEYYMKNGSKYPSPTQPDGYPYRDPQGIDVTRYRTRTVLGTYNPTKYYVCATSASGTRLIYQTSPCGTTNNPQYNYTVEIIYSCATEANGELVRANQVSQGATCKRYSEWSSPTTTKCNTNKPDICQSVTITFYYWYRLKNEVRKYYPSNATSASGEKTYFAKSPIKNAIKDESTQTVAYKWYKEVSSTTTNYTAVAPKGYYKAIKSSEYKWSDWSTWQTKNPKINDGRDRAIETKTKIKLQEIRGTSSAGWRELNTQYLTEEELIKTFKNYGYKINTLEDITNNGQIKYQLITFVRNKKESK